TAHRTCVSLANHTILMSQIETPTTPLTKIASSRNPTAAYTCDLGRSPEPGVVHESARGEVVIEDFRLHYNHRRPHSSLAYQTPAAFAASCAGGRSGRRRYRSTN